jgi:hypothetical protein
MSPMAGQDDMEKWKLLTLPGLELGPFSRPASSQSVYLLHYPTHIIVIMSLRYI